MDETTSAAVDWLLHSDEPAIRRLTRREVLGEPTGDDAGSADGPKVSALLAGQQSDGGFGGHPYHKWTGAHWRLISLAGLEVPAADPRVAAVVERVLNWISRGLRQASVVGADGLIRSHASIQGNALGAGCRFGRADDPRTHAVVEVLISWQWPDGGWNCDQKATGYRSSFHETLGPAWGLHEYAAATGDPDARAAADRAAELFLEHRLFRQLGTGRSSSPNGCGRATRRTGTTTSSKRSSCCLVWAKRPILVPPTRSMSWSVAGSRTVAGEPSVNGGGRPTAAARRRSSTGAGPASPIR